jgi:hypothetical protein
MQVSGPEVGTGTEPVPAPVPSNPPVGSVPGADPELDVFGSLKSPVEMEMLLTPQDSSSGY